MKNILIIMGALLALTSCTERESILARQSGVVDGIKHGASAESYIPYSKTAGNDTMATQQYVKDNAMAKGLIYTVVPDTTKIPMTLSRLGKSTQGASSDIDIYSTLAHFGGANWNAAAKYGISFGFKNPNYYSRFPHLWIGADTRNTEGRTNSDFVVATRNTVGDDMPTIKFRVTNDGYIKAWVGYVPKTKDDIVNKAFLDYKIPEQPKTGTYILTSVNGIVSWVQK